MTQHTRPYPPTPSVGPPAAGLGPDPAGYAPPPAGFGPAPVVDPLGAPTLTGPPPQPPSPPPPPGGALRRGGAHPAVIVAATLLGLIVVAAATLGVLVGFGPKTLDPNRAQSEIVRVTQAATGGLAPIGVQCPAGIRAQAGTSFTCTAQLDGQPVSYTVTQHDDQGNVTIDSTGIVILPKITASLQQQVSAQVGVPVTAHCDPPGKTVLIAAAGTPISCTVTNSTDPTDSAHITGTVTDTHGSVTFPTAG